MYVAVPAGVDGHCSQETTASQPAPFEAPFEVNLTVKQPVVLLFLNTFLSAAKQL